jgi:hypothetical protein
MTSHTKATPAACVLLNGQVHSQDVSKPGLHIADGTLEALKWLALLLMVLDHGNKWIFDATVPYVYEAGRLSAPVFAFVLAYNLTRSETLDTRLHLRTARRLALFGVLATPAFIALNDSWWPLNIMFTLLAGVGIVYGLARGTAPWIAFAGVVFGFSGAVAEYFYPGLLMFVAAWAYCRRDSVLTLAAWGLTVAAMTFINGNWWATLSVPLLLAAQHVDLQVPRMRLLFYVAYPVHLIAILCVVKS